MRSSSDTRRWLEHEGLDARMTTVAAAVVGSAVVSGVASQRAAKKSSSAASSASDAQVQQSYAAMDQQQVQFDRILELLSPYTAAATGNFDANAYLRANPDVAAAGADPYQHYLNYGRSEGRSFTGTQGSLEAQQNLLGLNGAGAQGAAISAIESSPYFSGLVKQGESAILQNASATGGLRGGNTQGALAQFRPNMLAAMINDQYTKLGGITSLGQNAAAGVGNAGQNMANANSQLLGQVGAARAGGILGQASGQVQGINGISSAFGTGLSGLSQYFNQPTYSTGITGTSGESGIAAYRGDGGQLALNNRF